MFNRIWKKFTLALLIVTFIPIGYFGFQDWVAAKASVLDDALRDILLNSVTRSKDVERVFINAHEDINYLRSSLAIQFLMDIPREKPKAAIFWRSLVEREFRLFLSLKPGYSKAGLIDEYGDEQVVVFKHEGELITLEDNQKRNRLTSPYYVKAAELEGLGVAAIPMRSSLEPHQNLKNVTLIRYATKIFDRLGKPRGVVYVDLNGSEILSALERTSFEQRRMAGLLNSDGEYIFNPEWREDKSRLFPAGEHGIMGKFSDEVVAQLLSGRHGVISDDPGSLFAFSSIYPQIGNFNLYYVVFDRYPKNFFAPAFERIGHRYIIGGFVALALVVIVSVVVSRALTRNLSRLRDGVESLRENKLKRHIEIETGDEIESLAMAFNEMADSIRDYQESLEHKVEERSRRIKQVERRLMQSEKLAAIGFLAAGVAHEVNNPISIIITRLELIKRDIMKGRMGNVNKDLDVLRNHATRVGKIATDLLTFSRESSKELTPVNLAEAVKRIMGLIEHSIKKKGVELSISIAPDLPSVMANQTGIEQVLYNIIYNAYQATTDGGRISVNAGQVDGGRVEISISDTGEGIPEDIIEHVFEPFFTTKEAGQGAGLGLSISYGLVREFGGSIEVESEPGKGTAFTINLREAPQTGDGSEKVVAESQRVEK